MLQATLTKNDSKAKWLIGIVSVIVFCTVTVLGKYNLAGKVTLPFDVHIFALINACLNGCVAFLLVLGLVTVKQCARRFPTRGCSNAKKISIA